MKLQLTLATLTALVGLTLASPAVVLLPTGSPFGLFDGTIKWTQQQGAHIFQMERLGAVLLVTLYSADLASFAFADGAPRGSHHLGEPYRLVPLEEGRVILCGQEGSWLLEATEGETE